MFATFSTINASDEILFRLNELTATMQKRALSKTAGDIRHFLTDPRSTQLAHQFNSLLDRPNVEGQRDSSYGLFHSLGKILYPRKDKEPIDVSELADIDRPLFQSYLHTNCLKHLQAINEASQTLDSLSWHDQVPWPVRESGQWSQYYGHLPELNLYTIVNGRIRTARPVGFYSMETPRRIHYQKTNDRLRY